MTEAPKYRVANVDDHTDILAVLEEVAPEVPVSLDTPASQAAIKNIIADCCASGESWVAVGADGTVIGFVLAKPDIMERFHHANNALSLRYIGVKKSSRRCRIFSALMGKLTAKGVPLTASVLHSNCSEMANRLMKIDFTKVTTDDRETQLRWAPPQLVKAQ